MRVVDQPVENGIAKSGVPDARVPVFDRQLAGDERGPTADAILDELEEIATFPVAERGEAPVVQLCRAPHNSTNEKRAVMWSVIGISLRRRIIWGR